MHFRHLAGEDVQQDLSDTGAPGSVALQLVFVGVTHVVSSQVHSAQVTFLYQLSPAGVSHLVSDLSHLVLQLLAGDDCSRAVTLRPHTSSCDGAVGPGHVVCRLDPDQVHGDPELPGHDLADLRVEALAHLYPSVCNSNAAVV